MEAKVATTEPFKGKFQENMTVVRPKGSKNVGKDTLNPGNITADSVPAGETKASYGKKIGAKGTYLSKNGREYFVFPTEEAGFAAMKRDISMKQAGKTQVKSLQNANATLKDYLRAHVGSDVTGTSYAKAVLKETGAGMDTPFRSVDTDALARGIAKAEGYGPKKGFSKADVSPVGGKSLTTEAKKGSMGGTKTTEPIGKQDMYSRLSSRDAIAKQLEKDGFDVSTKSSNSPGSKSEYITIKNDS